MKKILLLLIVLLAGSIALNVCQYRHREPAGITRDTLRDTVRYASPVPVERRVVRHDTAWLRAAPVYIHGGKTAAEGSETPQDSLSDSVRVSIPITQEVFADSGYKAWVSGYRPRLDSIQIYRSTITVTKTVERRRRLSWGLTGGVGYGLVNGKPDIFIGIGGCWYF
ncbi:DUF6808 domain-containing protein [Prevotella sp. KH2C16]|uniref:DUF6808 domain-containing protein n=1 Tax=Prevotella sp. KH2C16 TaxID=1855325 RepID=UPI000B846C4A|nr:hypothetical protein [Prevotella sp. KH2C16]